MPNSEKNANLIPVLALLLVQLIFGFNFAASKVVLVAYPPVLWGGIRLLGAAVLMFAGAFFIVPRTERRTDVKFLAHCFLYGVVGLAANQAFFMLGMKYTSTTNAAILNTLTPIFTLLFAIVAGSEKFTLGRGVGFLLAILGAVVIRKLEDFHLGSDTFRGDLFTILNCVSLALFFVMSRDFLKKNSPFWAMSFMFLFGAIVLIAIAYQDLPSLGSVSPNGTLYFAIFYNVVLATLVTYFLNSWALTQVKPSSVAIFIYFQPIIAVLNAWFSFGEVPNLRIMIAMMLIFAGVAVGVIKKA